MVTHALPMNYPWVTAIWVTHIPGRLVVIDPWVPHQSTMGRPYGSPTEVAPNSKGPKHQTPGRRFPFPCLRTIWIHFPACRRQTLLVRMVQNLHTGGLSFEQFKWSVYSETEWYFKKMCSSTRITHRAARVVQLLRRILR